MILQERESLAKKVAAGCNKLADLEDEIRALWKEFDELRPGEKILGCRTKKQFCVLYLHRTLRAVQYLLLKQQHKSEKTSPVSVDSTEDVELVFAAKNLVECDITVQNISDTRCLSMVRERLDFVQSKTHLLVTALADQQFDSQEVKKVLMKYLQAFQDYKVFVEEGINFLNKHGII